MKGDFTRNTFDRTKHFSRVLMQQGRVQLDADWNEQADIQQHRVQGLARDLIGPHGWPGAQDDGNLGFGIVDVNSLPADEQQRLKDANILPLDQGDFLIAKGRYYVDGIQCENEEYCTYLHQPDWPGQPELEKGSSYLVYLDVWERHITSMEDMTLRESGLGALGPDTATRAKTVWQVKVTDKLADERDLPADTNCEDIKGADWKDWLAKWQPVNRGQLKAKAMDAADADSQDACITPPDARYRGFENQLYRVEIHRSGEAGTATFKWSRDNGSVVFPVSRFGGGTVTLGDLGRDDFHTLEPGQWVELVDDDMALREGVNPLGKVKEVRPDDMMIVVDWPEGATFPSYRDDDYGSKHVLLRRWDHHQLPSSAPGAPDFHAATGTLLVVESAPDKPEIWLTLEQGIQILFAKPKTGEPHQYRSGDYWLIPARTSTGDVEWPGEVGKPDLLPPHGVEHHYAPLALISVGGNGIVTTNGNDCRESVSRGNAADITPASIGALATSDYLRINEEVGPFVFDENSANEAEVTIGMKFQPLLMLANLGYAAFDTKSYSGTFSALATFREKKIFSGCYSVVVIQDSFGIVHQQLQEEWKPDSLFYGIFIDNSNSTREELELRITEVLSDGLRVKLLRTESPTRLKWFRIILSLYCFG
jgi:uncharacterized protein DUF6519